MLLIVAACAGCAQTRWVHSDPAIGPADAEKAALACRYEAELATPTYSSGRGIGTAAADGVAQGARLAQLQRMCMETKGYIQVRAN